MKASASGFASGLVFGAGLVVSQMTRPSRVAGFLDVAHWDPTLMFVMAGAVGVAMIGWLVARRRRIAPLRAPAWPRPVEAIDARLIAGSVLFGAGWGLSGFCPGPAVVSLASGSKAALVFVPSMLGGMALWRASRKAAAKPEVDETGCAAPTLPAP